MWIFCCGMYRSASTLQFQITARLVKDADLGQQIGWIDWKPFPQLRDYYANQKGLKVCKVHNYSELIISEFRENDARGIYIFRDIRDVYAYSIKMMEKTFNELWNEGFLESCLDNYKLWENLPRVLVSSYENVMENISEEVRRIAEHLEINITSEQYQQIAAEYTLESQKKRI